MFDTTTWFALNRRIVIAAKLFSGQFKIKDEEMCICNCVFVFVISRTKYKDEEMSVRRKTGLRTNWRSSNIGPSRGNSRL